MFLPAFCYSPEQIKMRREREQQKIEKMLETVVDWDPKMKWEKKLALRASTFTTDNLFPDCEVSPDPNPNGKKAVGIVSPSGTFIYMRKEVPRGALLSTWYGGQVGEVVFDGPVIIPVLHQKKSYDESWRDEPWMSHSPAEIISMRGGTKRAKGSVIVAGLGLGYQLIEVSHRKQVTSLTLVERSQELVDWMLPRVKERMDPRFRKKLKVVVGDAYEELPKLTADVALVDIFDSYGNNDYERDRLRSSTCRNIGYVWCWGAAQVKDSAWSAW